MACRTRAAQTSLVRFVHSLGAWRLDAGRARAPGRGVYLCSPRCAERVRKHKRYGGLAAAAESAAWPRAGGLCE